MVIFQCHVRFPGCFSVQFPQGVFNVLEGSNTRLPRLASLYNIYRPLDFQPETMNCCANGWIFCQGVFYAISRHFLDSRHWKEIEPIFVKVFIVRFKVFIGRFKVFIGRFLDWTCSRNKKLDYTVTFGAKVSAAAAKTCRILIVHGFAVRTGFWWKSEITELGGGFKHFFHPYLGKWSILTCAYFSDGWLNHELQNDLMLLHLLPLQGTCGSATWSGSVWNSRLAQRDDLMDDSGEVTHLISCSLQENWLEFTCDFVVMNSDHRFGKNFVQKSSYPFRRSIIQMSYGTYLHIHKFLAIECICV